MLSCAFNYIIIYGSLTGEYSVILRKAIEYTATAYYEHPSDQCNGCTIAACQLLVPGLEKQAVPDLAKVAKVCRLF